MRLTWPQIAAFAAFVALVAPMLFGAGVVSSRLDILERDVAEIESSEVSERVKALEALVVELKDQNRLILKEISEIRERLP